MMKRLSVLIAVLAMAAGCGDDSPTAPATDDNRAQFTAQLLPSNEVPAVSNADATCRGEAHIDFNLTRDAAGAITASTVHFRVDFNSCPATTALTAAHIHTGASGVNGPVLVSAEVASGQVTNNNGSGTFSRLSINTTAANAQAIINNPAGFYFNVHSTANTGGFMRGQLVRQ